MQIVTDPVETVAWLETAAAASAYFETTADPTALSTLSRRAVLVRNLDEPIQFPYCADDIGSVAR